MVAVVVDRFGTVGSQQLGVLIGESGEQRRGGARSRQW